MTKLSEISGSNALSLNDLADLEEKFGSIDQINWNSFSVLRFVLWLADRKINPGKTERELGEELNMTTLQEKATTLLRASGLLPDEDAEGKA
jgi:hypothetical protein